jgi:N-methylhydantoinase B
MGVISGRDPRHADAPFVNQIFLGVTGGAGTAVTDGFLSIIHVGNAGLCRQDSVEVDELHHPIFVADRHLIANSEGAGEYRGALAAYAEFGPIENCTMEVLYTADGTINPAAGARGGGAGARAEALKRECDGSLTRLPACYGVKLAPGEFVVSHSAGGGGYGSPLRRTPERVLHDVREGWVTSDRRLRRRRVPAGARAFRRRSGDGRAAQTLGELRSAGGATDGCFDPIAGLDGWSRLC